MSINPVRYPGGKGRKSIVDRVVGVLPDGVLNGRTWYEPFCGGCGLGLELVNRNVVEHAVFNDGDERIADMWRAIAYRTDDMVSRIEDSEISMDLFKRSKRIANDESADAFERGFATFVLNRCCRSGYIDGGVIGGNDQSGKYKLDCRFNKKTLIGNIRRIGTLADDGRLVFLQAEDAIDMIGSVVNGKPEDAFLYVDPPYYVKGAVCYKRRLLSHQSLADALRGASMLGVPWLVSYDDCEAVRGLYAGFRIERLSVTYSNNEKTRGKAQELLITNTEVS